MDIETSPLISYTWGLYDQNVIERIKTFTILSFAYKWLGEKPRVVSCRTLTEQALLKKLHSILSEADVVIAHNGDSFDIKKINARFMVHKMGPPSPYRTVDTKKVAKSVAAFDSNSLNNLGIDLDEGEKIKHRGFDMWKGCMAGIRRDWLDMERYNKMDVVLLEKIYFRMLPWIKNHPNLSVYSERPSCPRCQSTQFQQARGTVFSNSKKYQRFQCMGCGGWARSTIGNKVSTLVSA